MNFKLNALVAAALLVAAGSANAAISTSTSGNGELFLVVSDTTAGYSFVGDLGIAMDSFNANLGQSFDLTSYSQWSAFNTAIGGTLNNATFAVLAVDSTGTAAGSDRMWVTSSTAVSAVDIGATKNNKMGAASNKADTLLGNLNANSDVAGGDMLGVANGSAYSASSNLTTYWANVGDFMQNNLPFSTFVDANEAANFGFMANSAATNTISLINYTEAAGQWTVGANTLDYTVASVPEAETYAMMLAGLGLVGFMVRRRNAA